MTSTDEKHCPSCICGKRASVQANKQHKKGPGTIAWAEHEEAWATYAAKYGRQQSAQRIHERGGFCFGEVTDLLGHEPTTWVPSGAVAERER